ncbi:MAG: glycoside hydrolase family 5 protein [Oscillospiraceae bacterium]|jgi:endoglucanase|nr:glycoside hydrolase family 5 protein [Oscillospiraceae bacterium]
MRRMNVPFPPLRGGNAAARALPLCLALALLCSCAQTSPPPSESDASPSHTASPSPSPPVIAEKQPGEMNSLEFARAMGYGINLGNTMESCNSRDRVPLQEPSVYETMWGQPVTTRAMIAGMKAAGFSTLRVPVAWTNAMDWENGDLTIDGRYLDRVEEIINYALDEGMYVIINDHWDHGWWSLFGHPDEGERQRGMDIFKAMWGQIAERYKDIDHRLVFEPANEEWGNRFNDRTAFSPTGGTLTQDECYAFLTQIAQEFVDLVRGSGGVNATRFLLIPGYNTDVAMTADSRYNMPVDKAPDKLMLSVHYYTPWSYCGDTSGVGSWGRTSEVEEMNELLSRLAKYTAAGYGVVLGEWGVLNNEGPDRLTFFTNFLDNCDKYGYAPMLWDTGDLYSRADRAITAPDIAALFSQREKAARAGLTEEDIVALANDNMAWTLRKAANKPETIITADEAFAWIMFSSGDWSVQYSVGDQYRPEQIAAGLVATDPEVTAGPGVYTVSLDFTGTAAGYADGIVFSAVGIINGEILFPGYVIDIKELLINGEQAVYSGEPYTTNDNAVTTRVNLYNEWVSDIPASARTASGSLDGVTPTPLSDYTLAKIETLSVTFEYKAP